MKHKTADLSGSLLARAVAIAAGYRVECEGREWGVWLPNGDARSFSEWGWRPDRDWEVGGPILGRIEPHFEYGVDDVQCELRPADAPYVVQWGPTMLVAAMRAYVAAKLGEEVELP